MPTVEELRKRLQDKLSELFQLDQPDLDFGFYRIMHAKADEVKSFIENDLLSIISNAFADVDKEKLDELQKQYDLAIQSAKDHGAPEPMETPAVLKAKAALDNLKDTASAEADVYDHLYRFFERYYEDGDFISRRYYSRETEGKAASYAIPYSGEEVKLHWANSDQYYIKTTEYFNNFTFDLKKAPEVVQSNELYFDDDRNSLKVHFRVVDATEGEHGNIKASSSEQRFFILHEKDPIEFTEEGELVVNFEFRPDPKKTGTAGGWQENLNKKAENVVTTYLQNIKEKDQPADSYLDYLSIPIPMGKDKNRILLSKYLKQYTSRNTMDFFIHKDLGGFLRRELDFYIKNEIMRLDDLDNADAPGVESYLQKIKVLRTIARKLIDFLAQLENFQKKLWLKKKFVVETNYCITLDRVPEKFYPEIASNDRQIQEWVNLFAVDEIQQDVTGPGFSQSLTVEFLKANQHLVLDTQFYDDNFKAKLIESIENFDEQCDGLLVHSENYQALALLFSLLKKRIDSIHIDPPYNTSTSGFLYKNTYEHSTWLTYISERISSSVTLLCEKGDLITHIDENEFERLSLLLDSFNLTNLGTIIWDKQNPMLGRKGIATQHEYILWRSNQNRIVNITSTALVQINDKLIELKNEFCEITDSVRTNFQAWLSKQKKFSGGEKAYKYIDDDGNIYRLVAMGAPEKRKDPKYYKPLIHPITKLACPVPSNGWSRSPETLQKLLEENLIVFGKDHKSQPQKIVFLKEDSQKQLTSIFVDPKSGKGFLDPLGLSFPYSHPVSMYETFLSGDGRNSLVLDYFAGSGTTGHAVINLNRQDGGNRKYILVEMGCYFDTVLKPRIAKVIYSENWKDGKPISRDTGISHCFKYIRLESYEDTLNNLQFDNDEQRREVLNSNPELRADYMLRYMLDVETQSSQSLLNIKNFANPFQYTLNVKKPGTDEYVTKNVDLLETFNYLIGLRVDNIAAPQGYTAKFVRPKDELLPEDQRTKLTVPGKITQSSEGPWWFRKVEGWVPKNPNTPNDGLKERVLVVWRNLTGDLEQDNLMLDEWFKKFRISPTDFEFDIIYVNGSNNLQNLKTDEENWKVRLTEEEFFKRMWD